MSKITPRVAITILLLAFFVAFAFGPTMRNLEATSNRNKKQAQLEKERSTTMMLEEQVEQAQSMDYVEQAAREQRLVRPGEVLYLVTPDNGDSGIEYRVKELQSIDEAWERVWKMLDSGRSGGEKDD